MHPVRQQLDQPTWLLAGTFVGAWQQLGHQVRCAFAPRVWSLSFTCPATLYCARWSDERYKSVSRHDCSGRLQSFASAMHRCKGSMPFRVERDSLTWAAAPHGRERMSRQVLELGHAQVGDGDEVLARPEAARGALGLLHLPVHGLDEGVGAVVDHAAHDRVEAVLDRGRQLLERLQPTAPGPTHPGSQVGRRPARHCCGCRACA